MDTEWTLREVKLHFALLDYGVVIQDNELSIFKPDRDVEIKPIIKSIKLNFKGLISELEVNQVKSRYYFVKLCFKE